MARDRETGQLGVAVQSHHFSVGSIVPWARAGIGAVATQAVAEPTYGSLGLQLMAGGKVAQEALRSLVAADMQAQLRQVGMIDSKGNVAVHTGKRCVPIAGHYVGDGFSCQSNFAKSRKVWMKMGTSYKRNRKLSFPERLVATLKAGQEAGGDIRGQQSAAVLVVGAQLFPDYYSGRILDLRVEDHPEPIKELERLLLLEKATKWNHKAIGFLSQRKYKNAAQAYSAASKLDPGSEELRFWKALSRINYGDNQANTVLRDLFKENRD